MKVYAFIKIKSHPQPDGPGAQFCDLISFHRVETLRSVDELNNFLPFPVDINIPCGSQYDRETKGRCGECEYNDPATCDVQKYCRGEWSEGDVEDPPRLLRKRRYRIGIDTLLTGTLKQRALKTNKTQQERDYIINWAETHVYTPGTVIFDKVIGG